MLRNQKNLFLTCGNRHPLQSKGRTSKTSLQPSHSLVQNTPCRSYAKISDYHKERQEKPYWPMTSSTNAIPTPYEIFNQKRYSPYSKQKFYELVKLYHPDRHVLDSRVAELSYETRLERYRLIIAANNILGDPVKRNAYDRYGAGWNGQPHICENENASRSGRNSSGNRPYNGTDGPSQNATWEDWERWYSRNGQPQDPNYVSNAAFVGIVMIFALLGGIGQATRASSSSFNFIEQRNALHNRVSMELSQIKKESTECNFQEERIHRFMKNRDPVGYSLDEFKDENLKKLVKSIDRCSQGNFRVRSKDLNLKGQSKNSR